MTTRAGYAAFYYDSLNRLTDQIDVGTNGGTAYTRPSTVPSRSDNLLVTSYGYDNDGYVQFVTDPKGIISRTEHDALGRTTRTIANYVDGDPSDGDDQTTSYSYDGSGHVLTLKAELPGGLFQETRYLYEARTTRGDGVNSNELLSATQYPDKSTGSASNFEQETYVGKGK